MVSASIPFVACEVFLRITTPDESYVWPPGLQRVFRPADDVMPGVLGRSRFYINAHGLRGDAFAEHQGHRILAIGGSTTECAYLDEEEAWPRLLQDKLNETNVLGASAWVGNAGHSGHSTRNHAVQLPVLLDQYPRIDTVLMLVGVNDMLQRLAQDSSFKPSPRINRLSRSEYEERMRQSFAVWPGARSHLPFIYTWRRLRRLQIRLFAPKIDAFVQDDAGHVYETWRAHRRAASVLRDSLPPLETALQEYAGNVLDMIDAARLRGVRIVFMTQASLWHDAMDDATRDRLWTGGIGRYQESSGHEYYSVAALAKAMSRYNDGLIRTCAAARVECFDLAGSLQKDEKLFYDGIHFTEEGAQRVAAAIAGYLTDNPPRARIEQAFSGVDSVDPGLAVRPLHEANRESVARRRPTP